MIMACCFLQLVSLQFVCPFCGIVQCSYYLLAILVLCVAIKSCRGQSSPELPGFSTRIIADPSNYARISRIVVDFYQKARTLPHMTFARAGGEMRGSEGKHAIPPSPQCMWHTMWLLRCGWGVCEWCLWWSWVVVQVHHYKASHDLYKGMGGDEWIRR